MKLTEECIFKGYWWLPDNPCNKVAGVLTYTPEDSILLELIGCFETLDGTSRGVFDGEEDVPLIYGVDSNAKEITLISCHSGFSLNLSSTFPIVCYRAQVLVHDKHINDLDEVCQYTAKIRFPELSHWAPPCAIEHRVYFGKNGEDIEFNSFYLPKYEEEAFTICKVNCENGVELTIKRNVSYNPDNLMLKPELEQYSYIEIKNPGRGISLRDMFSEMNKFQQFLSLATKRNVRPEEIWLNDPENRQDFKNGKSWYFSIHIFMVQRSVPNPAKLDRNRFLFCYEDVASNLSEILKKWMSDSDNLQPIKNHLVDSLVYKPLVGSVDFLQVIQAVEGIWWRFKEDTYRAVTKIPKKKTTLDTILKQLLDSLSTVPSISKMNLDIKTVVDSRNYYTHFVDKSKKPKTLDGWDLYEMTKKLRMILLSLVLEFMGLESNDIEKIVAKSSFSEMIVRAYRPVR